MRNYQTLTLIGSILTILIVLAIGLIFSTLSVMHGSFGNFTTQYGTQSNINQYNQGRQMFEGGTSYMSAAIPIVVFANVFAMIAVLVFKRQTKVVGISNSCNNSHRCRCIWNSRLWVTNSSRNCSIKIQNKAV